MFNKCKLGDIMSIYDFEVKDTQGNMVSLSEYKGKVLTLLPNVVSLHNTLN